MKKLLATITLLIYFAVSTGFVVSVHYCMDKLNGVEWGHADADACGKCGMPNTDNDGCCKDEVKVVKLQIDQTLAKLVKASFSVPVINTSATHFLSTPPILQIATEEPVDHGPPLGEQDLYLQNRVFRI